MEATGYLQSVTLEPGVYLAYSDLYQDAVRWKQEADEAIKRSEWTTEPPTVPGWYWIWGGGAASCVGLVEADGELVYVRDEGSDTETEISACDLSVFWIGPLTMSDPPKVD